MRPWLPAFALFGRPCQVRAIQLDVFRELGRMDSLEPTEFPGEQILASVLLRASFSSGYPAFMFRKSQWQAKGGVDERLRVGSDYDLLCWLCTRGSIVIDPAVHYLRREHETNVCNDRQKMFLDIAARSRALSG